MTWRPSSSRAAFERRILPFNLLETVDPGGRARGHGLHEGRARTRTSSWACAASTAANSDPGEDVPQDRPHLRELSPWHCVLLAALAAGRGGAEKSWATIATSSRPPSDAR